MSGAKFPPLKLEASQTSIRSSNSSTHDGSVSVNESARERRRRRRIIEEENNTTKQIPRSNRRTRSAPKQVLNNINDDENDDEDNQGKSNEAYVDDEVHTSRKRLQIVDKITNKPPKSKRRTRRGQQQHEQNESSTINMLEGLEEDVIEMDGYTTNETKTTPHGEENLSQRELLNNNNNNDSSSDVNNYSKSVPTDKFFLELEKKFEIQKKELYEKREQERLRAQFEWQLKQKQKEELKYQISTPKYALKTHQFLRTVFLFFHGVNVGYQFWLVIVIFVCNYSTFSIVSNLKNGLDLNNLSKTLLFFENLTMPIHCISYLFLTICVVDSLDRVDLSKMSLKYFVKCLAFQNQFWSIVAYLIALIVSLVLINVDQTVYSLASLRQSKNVTQSLNSQITNTINSNTNLWQYLNLVKAIFTFIGWFLFTILINHDRTYESLKNRDFSILDELVNNEQQLQKQQQEQQKKLDQNLALNA